MRALVLQFRTVGVSLAKDMLKDCRAVRGITLLLLPEIGRAETMEHHALTYLCRARGTLWMAN